MRIVKVSSNIKSPDGQAWSYDLGKLNLLVGLNESGKSAIAEAVQLAVSGSAHGLFFRNGDVKSGSQLGNLAASNRLVFAEVEYEDGSTSRWEMEPGKRPRRTGETTTVLPIAQLRGALSGSAVRARKFFAPLLIEEMSREKLEKHLSHPEYDLTSPLENVLPDYGNKVTAEEVVASYEEAGKWKRNSKAEAKAATEILSMFSGADKLDREAYLNQTENLTQALCFSWFKKRFKGTENKEERVLLKQMALSLGTKEELKALPGSAEVWDALLPMVRADALYTAAQRARKKVQNAELAAKEFSALEIALDSALCALMEKPLKEYCRRVNKFLPKGDKFSIEQSRQDFRIFLSRGGEKHYALSGSAEARTLAAMGSALAADGESAIIILDDRMWDTSNLARTMERLEKAPCQVIMMSTFKPRGRARSEWDYIDVVRKEDKREDEEINRDIQAEAGQGTAKAANV